MSGFSILAFQDPPWFYLLYSPWVTIAKGMTEDEMVGWHHQLDGHESEQALGVGDAQGSLASCSPWGRKESDMTEQRIELKGYDFNPGIWEINQFSSSYLACVLIFSLLLKNILQETSNEMVITKLFASISSLYLQSTHGFC